MDQQTYGLGYIDGYDSGYSDGYNECVLNYKKTTEERKQRKTEKKKRRLYFFEQKLLGLVGLLITVFAMFLLDDLTIAVITIPISLALIFSRDKILLNKYFWETKENEKEKNTNENE
jgi:hypothetical protein